MNASNHTQIGWLVIWLLLPVIALIVIGTDEPEELLAAIRQWRD